MSTHQRKLSKASFYIDIEKSASDNNTINQDSLSSGQNNESSINSINIDNPHHINIENSHIENEIKQLLKDDSSHSSSSKKSNLWIKIFTFIFSLLIILTLINFLCFVIMNHKAQSNKLNNINLDDEDIIIPPPSINIAKISNELITSTKSIPKKEKPSKPILTSFTMTPEEYQQQYKQYQDQPVLPHNNFFPYKDDSSSSTSSDPPSMINVPGASTISSTSKLYDQQVPPQPHMIVHVENESELDQSSTLTKAQSDLKEIFAVNPIILISNNNQFQHKFETILMNINIHPEPKIVNLIKHPNYKSILSYLESTFEDLNDDDNVDYKELDEDDKESLHQLNKGDNIPRLFIGGVPHGNYYKILDLFEKNQLQSYLRENGKGKITIG
ncbi:hypothetical protein DFJ63DRAFT_25260 [Scheffersomyces coipomensis]|uniref:uncharacterized protein n=1 Tax=Scheffersomyces coipomensis TaxID=1788519 RepID=UPI00315C6702